LHTHYDVVNGVNPQNYFFQEDEMRKKTLPGRVICIFLLLVFVCFAVCADGQIEKAKYIFLFIGDGMGISHIALTEGYVGYRAGEKSIPFHFSQFPSQGITLTYSLDSFIPDSAAAGTALATGYKTNNGMISQLPDGTVVKTLMEIAKELGLSTGMTTTTRITHATPAAFMAHNADRDNENDIAVAVSLLGVDVITGGGYRHMVPGDWERGTSKRNDERNLLLEMEKKGYRVFVTEEETEAFLNYTPGKNDKVVALFGPSHLSHEIDRYHMGLPEPSLAHMTRKGIEILSAHAKGFFYVIEGGRIDYGGHNNDAVTSIHDVLAFNDAVNEAIKFYYKHPEETLIIVTSDHETGGLSLGCAHTEKKNDFGYFFKQTISYERFNSDVLQPFKKTHTLDLTDINNLKKQAHHFPQELERFKDKIEKYFGLDISTLSPLEMEMIIEGFKASMLGDKLNREDELIHIIYGLNDPLLISITRIMSQRAGVCWTSFDHTANPVATYALGVGDWLFDGYYESADICKKIAMVMSGEKRKQKGGTYE
jgi:alkaline phosphatase